MTPSCLSTVAILFAFLTLVVSVGVWVHDLTKAARRRRRGFPVQPNRVSELMRDDESGSSTNGDAKH